MEGAHGASDQRRFVVIVNDEEQQHCLWRSDIAVPSGWRWASGEGSQAECLELMGRIAELLARLHALTRGK